MTPLAGADLGLNSGPTLSAANPKTPATPLSVSIADIPSPTLQNIVSTVNLGRFFFMYLLLKDFCLKKQTHSKLCFLSTTE